ncbi:hypothetical protein PVAP13_2KG497600 [Panicum virgatum]|uniref:Uncharacterized protein n=1 Tax=Panicum virgatum TaxID=38727 RepID=A0A8T0WNP8_PANVG|nr:hypothetical protein PVAP13_2KG497600 [Panicum virgatum]
MTWVLHRRLHLLVVLVAVVIIYFLIITSNRERISEASSNKLFSLLDSNTMLQTIENTTTSVSYPDTNFVQDEEICKSLAQDFEASFTLQKRGKS